MLPVRSKYKIAKRLGAGVFEQTQTQKFALSEARSKSTRKFSRGGSDYGRQLLEKQRVRYTYGLSEKQLSNYAAEAMKQEDPANALWKLLELRADSVAYRSGLAQTRRAARQAVSHGHFTINGRRTTTPSAHLSKGDTIAVREGSRRSPLFAGLADQEQARSVPQWIATDLSLMSAKIENEPSYNAVEAGLDFATVFEFYSR